MIALVIAGLPASTRAGASAPGDRALVAVEWSGKLDAGDPPRFLAPTGRAARKMKLGGDTRNGIVVQPGKPVARPLRVPEDSALEIAVGLACPENGKCDGATSFRVDARLAGGASRTLFERTLGGASANQGWIVERVDLAPIAGSEVEIELRAVGKVAGTKPAIPVFGEPILSHPRERSRTNLLLVSLDTLRADHVGVYGSRRPTTPRLDAMARQGVVFRRAVSNAAWTTPSHMSLFTSLHPSTHGVTQSWAELDAFLRNEGRYRVLADEVLTLAEILRGEGYTTAAVTGSGTVAAEIGFSQGFDVYTQTANRLEAAVWTAVDRALTAYRHDPFFLFFHTFEIHEPYERTRFLDARLDADQRERLREILSSGGPPGLQARILEWLRAEGLHDADSVAALYDGGIRYADDFLGRLLDRVRALGLENETLVVVTSDHGEEIGDHGDTLGGHGHSLYREIVQVPLVMRLPGRLAPGTIVEQRVQLIDVAPTVLDLLGLRTPPEMQGKSFLEVAGGSPPPARERPVLLESTIGELEWKALVDGRFKYILSFPPAAGDRTAVPARPSWEALFDLVEDEREQKNLLKSGARAEQAEALREILVQMVTSLTAVGKTAEKTIQPDPELREQLRALGYVE